ncbi:MAG: metal ABC transporter substrate-binding protein [Propionibacteriaceae bacterium]|nr:metal ABC transporter substrate-binding protein [Propionibacteriaceae bacterium]
MNRSHAPRRLSLVFALFAAGLALAGCVSGTPAEPDTTGSDKLLVVVGLYPYAFAAQRLAGDDAEIVNLTQPGAEPHDLELTAKQVAQVGQADLVVFQRGLQPAVDAAVAQASPAHTLDVTTIVSLTEREQEDGADEEEGDGLDPHVWLDVDRFGAIAIALGQALGQADPAHAADYAARADSLQAELADLDADYRDGLDACASRAFITSHAAFGYLADRYSLIQIPIAGLSPEAEPGPAWLARVQAEAEANHLTTVFTEPLSAPDLAESLAADLGLAVDVLDPIEGITDASAATDYMGLMRDNLEALRTANGCD